jgi:hypothetical protein
VRKAITPCEKSNHKISIFKEKFTIFKDAMKGFHHFVMKFSILEELFITIEQF